MEILRGPQVHGHFPDFAEIRTGYVARGAGIALAGTCVGCTSKTWRPRSPRCSASSISLASDNLFSDGAALAAPTITGGVSAGYALALNIGIAG